MPEYALGLLDGPEAAELRAHLAGGCPRCAAALAEAEAALAQLPLALPPVAPPGAARARLLARLPAREAPAASKPAPIPFPTRRVALVLGWVASLALVLGGAQWHAGRLMADLNQRADGIQTRIADIERQLTVAKSTIATLSIDKSRADLALASAQQTIAMLRSSNLKLVEMQAHDPQQPKTLRARALWDRDTQHWQLIIAGMKPAEAGKVYELWFVSDKPIAATTFQVDARGEAVVTVPVPIDAGTLQMAAVTDEPGLLQAPTGQYQMLGKLNL
jgi:hypothetical protein